MTLPESVRNLQKQSDEATEERSQVVEGVQDRDLYQAVRQSGGDLTLIDDSTNTERRFTEIRRFGKNIPGKTLNLDLRPPALTPEEIETTRTQAAEFLAELENQAPGFAAAIRTQPQLLTVLPEIGMYFDGDGGGAAIDVTRSFLGEMPDALDYRSYADTMFQTPVQSMFWDEVASNFSAEGKDIITYLFAQLEERGADRVASKAYAWLRNNPLENEGQQEELLLRLWNWADSEQDAEQMDEGIFGALDWLQERGEEAFEMAVINPLLSFGDPDELTRRSGLTAGQQAMYQLGLDPDDQMWDIGSGLIDAGGEFALDLLNVAAGIGVASKAVKSIAITPRALQHGRAILALKSAIPIFGRRVSPLLEGGSIARFTYALRAKTVDQVLDGWGASRTGRRAYELLNEGNVARFAHEFPQFKNVPETFYEAAKQTSSPGELAELIKHTRWTDNMNDPGQWNEAVKTLDNAKARLLQAQEAGVATHKAELDVLRAQMRVDQMKLKPNRVFVINELPAKPQLRFLDRQPVRNFFDKQGPVRNTLARWTADLTQGVPSEINMFSTKTAMRQVRQLLDHYGVQPSKIDGLLNKFRELDVGDRMPFMIQEVFPEIGRATNNPLVTHNMVQFYKRFGERGSVASGTAGARIDEVVDLVTGEVKRVPVIPSHLQEKFPVPVKEIDEVLSRYRQTGTLKALGLGTQSLIRGMTPGTRARRSQLVQRIRNLFGDKIPSNLTDDDLYKMAYSWVGDGRDPRGWMAKSGAFVGNQVIGTLDQVFRRAALAGRPAQWFLKVVAMEEPLRAHVYGMPNMYSRPLSWVSHVLSNHYLNKADDWARTQAQWIDGVKAQVLSGVRSPEDVIAATRAEFGVDVAEEIFGGKVPTSLHEARARLGSWLHKASLSTTDIKKIRGGQRLDRAVRARKYETAQKVRAAELLGPNFRPQDDIEAINHKMLYTLFGDGVATSQSSIRPFFWSEEMPDIGRRTYGMAWGDRVHQAINDPAVQWELRRRIAMGDEVDDIWGEIARNPGDFVRHSDATASDMKGGFERGGVSTLDSKWDAETLEHASKKSKDGIVYYFRKSDFISGARRQLDEVGQATIKDPLPPGGRPKPVASHRASEARPVPQAASYDAKAFLQTDTWKKMKGTIRQMFPDEADDLARVDRYLTEKVGAYVDDLLQPFNQPEVSRIELYDNLVNRKRLSTNLNGTDYDIDLRSYGHAQRQLTELVMDQAGNTLNTKFPREIVADFNPGFLDASSDRKGLKRMVNYVIQTFGEDASQTFNRRPAWRYLRKRWMNHYRDMGIPEPLAIELAEEKAAKIVNYVMYDLSEAPQIVKKLNNRIPFFGAAYEVAGTWAYKMPMASGGYWGLGQAAFARRIGRMMNALVSVGLLEPVERDGKTSYELQFWREPDVGTELGDQLSRFGYFLRRSPEVAITHLLNVWPEFTDEKREDFLASSKEGYGFTTGNPIDPTDFGIFSFFQFQAGLSPAVNWIVNEAAGAIQPAVDVQRANSGAEDTTLADLADKLEVDVDDLVKANYAYFLDQLGADVYLDFFQDKIDPMDVTISANTEIKVPGTALADTLVGDVFFPFGEVETAGGVVRGMVPGAWQWVLRGMGISGSPSDGAWLDDSGELDTLPFFGTPEDRASMNSQLLEAFYYLESTEGTFSEYILPRQVEYEELILKIQGGGASSAEKARADELKGEIEIMSDHMIKRATDVASGGMILRGLAGHFFPNTGRAIRQEADKVSEYWNTRAFAEQLRGTGYQGEKLGFELGRKSDPADLDTFFNQVGNWLMDPTGDGARAFIRENNPDILAYLQPKTFWGAAGTPPEIESYEDYLDQIRSGDRKPVPLAVAVQRHLHAGLESDRWVNYVAKWGNDPIQAAANALANYEEYLEDQEEHYDKKDALYLSDDLHGGEYLKWLDARGTHDDDEYESVEEAIDRQREAFDILQEVLDLELDATMTSAEIADHRKIIRTTLARFSDLSDALSGDAGDDAWRNPFELAMNKYWVNVYETYQNETDVIWDQIGDVDDVEEKSLLFEQLKLIVNDWSQKVVAPFEDRPEVVFPTPLDISWKRKTPEEQFAHSQRRASLPLEWLNLDDTQRIVEQGAPGADQYLPTTSEQMKVYSEWVVKKVELDEMQEAGILTDTEVSKMKKALEEKALGYLISAGREKEVEYLNMWPVEKLYVTGFLPETLEYLLPTVRFIKQSLAAAEVGPTSKLGDKLLLPVYQEVRGQIENDPVLRDTYKNLGMNLWDEGEIDAILPRLLADIRYDF